MSAQKPSVGRIVHYVSHGSPVLPDGTQRYKPECRAAVVTEVDTSSTVGLAVLNPTGMFFDRTVTYHEGDIGYHAGAQVPTCSYNGGTWHWPERAE